MTEGPDIDLTGDRLRRDPSAHRWWARRGSGASIAVLLLTNDPDGASDDGFLQSAAADPDLIQDHPLAGKSVLDLCSGAGTVAAAAQRLGARVTAIDNHPIPVLIARASLELPPLYAQPNSDSPGSAANGTWAGLAAELGYWSSPLIERWKERSGDAWLTDVHGLGRSRVLRCAACGHVAGASNTAPAPDAFVIGRGSAKCPSCGHEARAWDLATGAFITRFVVSSDRDHEVRPPTDALIDIVDYPEGAQSRLDDTWAVGATRLTFREATSPRQAQLLRAAQESFRSVRDELADRGYAPEHAAALLTLMALALSGLVDQLSTVARWDERRKAFRGLDRHEWTWTSEFLEVGGRHIESQLRRRIDELMRIVESGPSEPAVLAESGDMRSLHLGNAEFDLVVWDPPFYDNIDYERIALPFTRFLRVLVGDLYPELRWTLEPAAGATRERFDHEHYDEGLRQASSEIARVLRPGGRLGVFWFANGERTTADLSALLEALEPSGLELIQSAALRTESSPTLQATAGRSTRQPVFLVFRLTKSARPANAATVLEGAVSGRSVTYGGLVDLLMANLEDQDVEDLIPASYRGTTEQRLLEVVLSQPDPRDLLAELSKRSLRTFIEERTEPGSATSLSRGELEDEAFGLLGWQVPAEPDFTIGAALDDAEKLTSQLRLAQSEDEIRGAGFTAFDRIEQVARFAVTTWATWLRSDDWRAVLDEVVGRSERLTFGDWVRALAELPGRYASEEKLIGQINGRVRSSKVVGPLKEVVALRNRFAHAAEGMNWPELRDQAVKALQVATKRLRAADEAGALPEVLQPLRETRDTYGRITLRLTGHRGQVEFLMSETSDLVHPIIVLRGETNPREFDPTRLPADVVSERAGVVRS